MEGVEVLIVSGGDSFRDTRFFLLGLSESCYSSVGTIVLRMPFECEQSNENNKGYIRKKKASDWLIGLGLMKDGTKTRKFMKTQLKKKTMQQLRKKTCGLVEILCIVNLIISNDYKLQLVV